MERPVDQAVQRPAAEPQQVLARLPLERIAPNPLQPRRRFPDEQLQALAASLAHQGTIQPLVVRPHPERPAHYELVAGERRLRAMRLLGWDEAPALVREIADGDLLESALVENLQREPLSPVEEAQALRDLLERHGYTQDELARRIGRDRSTIANLVRLLALPVAIREDLDEGRLTVGHARALLPLEDVALQLAVRNEVLGRRLSVRETERLVRRQLDPRRPAAKDSPPEPDRAAAAYAAVSDALERRFGTRVRVERTGERGTLSFSFADTEEFNRIYDLLMGRAG